MKKVTNDTERLRPQEADGIQEFDNDMPRWWVGLFYLTIVIGVLYGIHKYLLGGESLIEAYNQDLKQHQDQLAHNQAAAATSDATAGADDAGAATSLIERLKSPEYIAAGKEIFAQNCAPCHGVDGGGVIGPNLTDHFFIHGNQAADFVKVIGTGVPAKGMVSWLPVLGAKKVEQAAAYAMTLVGTTPAKAKAPEGQEIK